MAMPSAQGLFHRAVVESGPMVWGVPVERATKSARHALAAMQIAPDKLDALQTLTMEQILKVYGTLAAEGATRSLAPVVDGRGPDERVLDSVRPQRQPSYWNSACLARV